MKLTQVNIPLRVNLCEWEINIAVCIQSQNNKNNLRTFEAKILKIIFKKYLASTPNIDALIYNKGVPY